MIPLLAFLPVLAGAEPTASDLIHKANDVWRGRGNHGSMVMTVQNPEWTSRKTIEGWTDGRDKAMIVIRSPLREKGITTLRVANDLWTWLPRAERVLRIPMTMMHDPWMGSDFDYEDIVKAGTITTDYDHRIVEKLPGNGSVSYTLESTPKPAAPEAWSRVITKGKLYPNGVFHDELEEYYGEGDQLIRKITFSDYRRIGEREVPFKLECVPLTKQGHKTTVSYSQVEFDLDLKDEFFSLRRLQAHD